MAVSSPTADINTDHSC